MLIKEVRIVKSVVFRDCWDLYVNGKRELIDESQGICERVRDSLLKYCWDFSEADEVADSITKATS